MVSLDDCPPGPLLLLLNITNSICLMLNCPNWRTYLPSALSPWLSYDLPKSVSETFAEHQYPDYATFLSTQQSENDSLYEHLSSLYKYAFQTPTTALADLTSKDSMIALFICVLIIRKIKSIALPYFCTVGRNVGRSTHGEEWEAQNEERIVKFGEYVFRFLYHCTLSIIGVYYFWDKPWWNQEQGGTKNFFLGFLDQPVEPGMIWYYFVQSAYNVDSLVSLIELSFTAKLQNPFKFRSKSFAGIQSPLTIQWSTTCRGDFREMAAHHVITNMLVLGSRCFRLTRSGSAVIFIHDISDVPVDMSKLANYMKWKITTIASFVIMVIVWAYTRLGILPLSLFRSVLFESHLVVTHGGIDADFYYMYKPIFVCLMGGIIGLQIFWFFTILKIGYYLVFKNELHDLSEQKDGEDQEVYQKKQK